MRNIEPPPPFLSSLNAETHPKPQPTSQNKMNNPIRYRIAPALAHGRTKSSPSDVYFVCIRDPSGKLVIYFLELNGELSVLQSGWRVYSPSPRANALERFCSAARISARSDKSGEALRATRRSGARSATRSLNLTGSKKQSEERAALFAVRVEAVVMFLLILSCSFSIYSLNNLNFQHYFTISHAINPYIRTTHISHKMKIIWREPLTKSFIYHGNRTRQL